MRIKSVVLPSVIGWLLAALPAIAQAESPQLSELLPSEPSVSISSAVDTIAIPSAKQAADDGQLPMTAAYSTEASALIVEDVLALESGIQEKAAGALPTLDEVLQLQQQLEDIANPEVRSRRRAAYPSITIANPTGYGADRGRVFAGASFQSRSRFSGGENTGTVFGGGAYDGTAGIGFGIGDARQGVGLQISYTAASFGGSRSTFSGGINAKLHKQFGNRWAAAVGGDGIINFGELPEGVNGEVVYNDFENTYYGVATHIVRLKEDFDAPFSRLILTGGVGSGRFRTSDQIINGEFAIAPFGSASLQVMPWANLITEWTGQDLAVGASFVPFSDLPIVVTPAIRDIAGESDGDPRFVLGVGVSVTDLFSR